MNIIAKDLDMNLFSVSCPTLTIEALSGLPTEYNAPKLAQFNMVPDTITEGTAWSVPEVIANVNTVAEHKPTILLLDDFHMIQPHLQAYFFKLLLERMIGNFKLADNVVILGTMNDSEEAGMNQINSAVRNRLAILPIKFDFQHWFNGYGNNLHYLVASFLKTREHYVSEDESTGIEGYATARAWTAIAAELEGLSHDMCYTLAPLIAATQVSKEAAQAFSKHTIYVNAVNFMDIVKNKRLLNVGALDPIEEVVHSYIPNFIKTIDEGVYLLKLLEANAEHESFIGFTLSELYIKYTASEELSDGLQYVINTVLGKVFVKADYPNITAKQATEAKGLTISNMQAIMSIAATYIID